METGAKAFYEIVETFVNSVFKIISAFLALIGFDGIGSIGGKDDAEDDAAVSE